MQYDVKTPEEYMKAIDDDWRRETLMDLRQVIKNEAPELSEAIRYKMLSYEDARGQVFALNAQKGYVSFYVGDAEKVDPSGQLLAGLDRGKGCIRFRQSNRVADTKIDEFISMAVQLRRDGKDIGC
ncbi:MAG: DUF1801 domain-containing protein [Candidatus Krumholzibacteria bacterium]|nr:DUF1801 domain-containing protein [Candidatus Krumholzibacteria bacterium]